MKNFKPWKKYPLIAGKLAEVDTLIQHTIQTPIRVYKLLY